MPLHANAENLTYLRTKRERMGHDLVGLDDCESRTPASARHIGLADTDPQCAGSGAGELLGDLGGGPVVMLG